MTDRTRKTLHLPAATEKPGDPSSRRSPVRGGLPKNRQGQGIRSEARPEPREASVRREMRTVNQPPEPALATMKGRDRSRTGSPVARGAAKPAWRSAHKVPAAQTGAPAAEVTAGAPAPSAGEKPLTGVRVSKLMAERGLCSRRDADEYIVRGLVYVDGQRIERLGTRADPAASISLDPAAHSEQRKQVTILLNKPVGYVSGQPEAGCVAAVTLIQAERQVRAANDLLFQRWFLHGLAPAGRLDVDSSGLLVLTQDGRIARQLIGEESVVDKEYLVRVAGSLDEAGLALLNHGLSLDSRPLKPARVEWLNPDQLRFVLQEGRKRQIRRMCESVGLRVTGLKRVRIGRIRLGDLPVGHWRLLRADEAF